MSAQNVPTKSEYWYSFKDSAGALGEMLNEWLMNVVSATKIVGAAATGYASWMKIREINCLVLDSHTCIGNGDANSMREMFSIGTQSTGVHNMKGHGTFLLEAKLGGSENRAADVLVVTIDAQARKGATYIEPAVLRWSSSR